MGFEEWLTTALWERVVLIELDNGLIERDAAMIWMTGPHTVGFARREETLAAIGKVTQTRERGISTEDEFREERRWAIEEFTDLTPRALVQASFRAAVPDVLAHAYAVAAPLVAALASPYANGRYVSVVFVSECPHPLTAMLGEELGAWHSYGHRLMGWAYSPLFGGWIGARQQPALRPSLASAVLDSGRELSLVVGASSAAYAAAKRARAFLTTDDITVLHDVLPNVPMLDYDASSDPRTVLDWVEEHVPTPAFPGERDSDADDAYLDALRRRRDYFLETSAAFAGKAAKVDELLTRLTDQEHE